MGILISMLTSREFAVLGALLNGGEKYGLELVKESEGLLKRGTVYVLLGRMESKGLITSRREEDASRSGTPRRLYKPAGAGQRAFSKMRLLNAKLAGGAA